MSTSSELLGSLGKGPVHIERNSGEWESVEGIVVACSDKWCLIAVLADGFYDGFAAIRTSDVSSIEAFCSNTFIAKSYKLLLQTQPIDAFGMWHASDLETLVNEAGVYAPVVAICRELSDANDYVVGLVEFVTSEELVLTEITAEADLGAKAADVWPTSEISRLEFGSRYLRRLADIVLPDGPPTAS